MPFDRKPVYASEYHMQYGKPTKGTTGYWNRGGPWLDCLSCGFEVIYPILSKLGSERQVQELRLPWNIADCESSDDRDFKKRTGWRETETVPNQAVILAKGILEFPPFTYNEHPFCLTSTPSHFFSLLYENTLLRPLGSIFYIFLSFG